MPKVVEIEAERELARVIGQHIRARRVALGIRSPSHVHPTLNAAERGQWMPRTPVLLEIAKALKCTISDLTGENDGRPRRDPREERAWQLGYQACALDVMEKVRDLREEHR